MEAVYKGDVYKGDVYNGDVHRGRDGAGESSKGRRRDESPARLGLRATNSWPQASSCRLCEFWRT